MTLIQISKTDAIISLSQPYNLRINKQIGMMASDLIDPSSPETVTNFGRGKHLKFAPVLIDTNLWGQIGKTEPKQWGYILGVILQSDSPKLPRGLLFDCAVYGYELKSLISFAQEAELAAHSGKKEIKIVEIKFDRQVTTQYSSIIKPPTITFTDCAETDKPLAIAAQNLWETHPQPATDPTHRYPQLQYLNHNQRLLPTLTATADIH